MIIREGTEKLERNENVKIGEVFERERAGGKRPHETEQGCQNKKTALKGRISLWEFLV